eukprot:316249-Prorocentrum_minimum.AAC.2
MKRSEMEDWLRRVEWCADSIRLSSTSASAAPLRVVCRQSTRPQRAVHAPAVGANGVRGRDIFLRYKPMVRKGQEHMPAQYNTHLTRTPRLPPRPLLTPSSTPS